MIVPLVMVFASIGVGTVLGLSRRRARRGLGETPEDPLDLGASDDAVSPTLPEDVPAPRPIPGLPFAEGIARPVWPLDTSHPRDREVSYVDVDGKVHGRWGRPIGAARAEGTRNHAGVDLFSNAGDPVLAIADGTLVAVQSFKLGSWAVLVDHGAYTVLYGEVEKHSWRAYGLRVGDRVAAGEPFAEVACMRTDENGVCTSHMLHLETYVTGTKRNARWYDAPPPSLLDPTLMLLLAVDLAGEYDEAA